MKYGKKMTDPWYETSNFGLKLNGSFRRLANEISEEGRNPLTRE
jgi:hypothetical protein